MSLLSNPLVMSAAMLAIAAILSPVVHKLVPAGEKKLDGVLDASKALASMPKTRGAIELALHFLAIEVMSVYDSTVADLKREGKFDATAAASAKIDALNGVFDLLSKDKLSALMDELGFDQTSQVRAWLAKALEVTLAEMKAKGFIPAGVTLPAAAPVADVPPAEGSAAPFLKAPAA